MFTDFINSTAKFNKKLLRLKILLVIFAAVIVTSSHSKEIIENEVEDQDILVSDIFGGEPNVLLLFGASQSMGTSFGGVQFGNWDREAVISSNGTGTCQKARSGYLAEPWAIAHCAGNASGINICGSIACSGTANGLCDTPSSFDRFISCAIDEYALPPTSSVTFEDIINVILSESAICGGTTCTTPEDRAHAAASIEIAGMIATDMEERCGVQECSNGVLKLPPSDAFLDPACNTGTSTSGELGNYIECMEENYLQPNSTNTCSTSTNTGTEPSTSVCGQAQYGSTKMDAVLTTFFDLIDVQDAGEPALDSDIIPQLMCTDNGTYGSSTNLMFDGENNVIACEDFMNTPFRNVTRIVQGTGTASSLPLSGTGENKLIDLLDNSDQVAFPARIRPVGFGGVKANSDIEGSNSCSGPNLINAPQGGFAGGSQLSFDNIWRFFRDIKPEGRAILAGAIGHDDDSSSNSKFGQDALRSFDIVLQTDNETGRQCAGNFSIIITDGQDHCSGEVNGTIDGSYEHSGNYPPLRGFANIRSSINATNRLRTYFVRNPDGIEPAEIMNFVICLGVPESDIETIRMCNAMALAGGTHTGGLIAHTDHNNNEISGIDISGLTNLSDDLKALGMNDGATTPIQGCNFTNEDEDGDCSFDSTTGLFQNSFFTDTSDAFTDSALNNTLTYNPEDPAADTAEETSFAFFVKSPQELQDAINAILENVATFPTAGVAPTAPRSSTAVAARDRIFLSQLRPIEDERIWQGRLALYGFIQDPENPGARVIIRDPQPSAAGFSQISEDLTDEISDATLIDNLSIFDENGFLNDNAQAPHWEAGKLLAERQLSTDPRRLFTVNSLDITSTETSSVVTAVDRIRYEGDLIDFCYEGSSGCTTGIDEDHLGISFADVSTDNGAPRTTVPAICQPDPANPTPNTCEPYPGATQVACPFDATFIDGSNCANCLEQCFAFNSIDFLMGNTKIIPRGDPLGEPGVDVMCDSDSTFIGCDCPQFDELGDIVSGTSYERCSVRLGDIFHSTPVLVGSPSALFFDTGFQVFARQYRQRSAAAYVGANDAFYHAFHAGEFQNASTESGGEIKNPFTNKDEVLPFFDEGTGEEMFAFTSPTMQPDSISNIERTSPSGETLKDYRFGDMKSFFHENNFQRSFFDGSSLVADIFIDGTSNGIVDDADLCESAENVSQPNGLIDECGKEWHTVLLAGARNGGGLYTALNITNANCEVNGAGTGCDSVSKHIANGPDYPEHMWTLFDKDFGNTWSDPAIGRVRLKTVNSGGNDLFTDRWVMFVGGGLHPTDTDPLDNATQTDAETFGNAFYAVDITTGQIVYKFHPQDPIPNTIGDDDLPLMTCDMAAEVGVFDINADGFVDLALAGDTCGRLWEFDVSMPIVDTDGNVQDVGLKGNGVIEAQDWSGHITFCATSTEGECSDPSTFTLEEREPIYFAPTVVLDDTGRRHVILQTGNRREPSDVTESGKLYNFIDTFVPAFLAGGSSTGEILVTRGFFEANSGLILDLVTIAGSDPPLFTTEGGTTINNQGQFMVRFPNNVTTPQGEKGQGTPVVINRALVFTTFAPPTGDNSDDPCQAGSGQGRVFALDYLSGEPALGRIPGAEEILNEQGDPIDVAGIKAADGLPTPAQLTFGAKGSVLFSVAFSGGSEGGANFLLWELPPFPSRTQTLFWEEII